MGLYFVGAQCFSEDSPGTTDALGMVQNVDCENAPFSGPLNVANSVGSNSVVVGIGSASSVEALRRR